MVEKIRVRVVIDNYNKETINSFVSLLSSSFLYATNTFDYIQVYNFGGETAQFIEADIPITFYPALSALADAGIIKLKRI